MLKYFHWITDHVSGKFWSALIKFHDRSWICEKISQRISWGAECEREGGDIEIRKEHHDFSYGVGHSFSETGKYKDFYGSGVHPKTDEFFDFQTENMSWEGGHFP